MRKWLKCGMKELSMKKRLKVFGISMSVLHIKSQYCNSSIFLILHQSVTNPKELVFIERKKYIEYTSQSIFNILAHLIYITSPTNTYYFANEYVLLCQRIRITLPTNTYYFAFEYVFNFFSSLFTIFWLLYFAIFS